jgi:hypothetical protein
MMIHLSNELSKNNTVVFFTTIFSPNNFDEKFNFAIKQEKSYFKIITILKIAYKIRKFDIVFV